MKKLKFFQPKNPNKTDEYWYLVVRYTNYQPIDFRFFYKKKKYYEAIQNKHTLLEYEIFLSLSFNKQKMLLSHDMKI